MTQPIERGPPLIVSYDALRRFPIVNAWVVRAHAPKAALERFETTTF